VTKQPGAHRRDRLVDHPQQRAARITVAGGHQLQRLHRRAVQRHRLPAGETLQSREVAQPLALGGPHVGERATGGAQADRHIRNAEHGERGDAEMRLEIADGPARREGRRVPERERGAGVL
jgi:hypothetical protein